MTDQRHGDELDEAVRQRLQRLIEVDRPRLARLWAYYRNPMIPHAVSIDESGSDRPYRQAQEWGLPSRITGVRGGTDLPDVARKEVVIENDIGWRIDTQVDYLFGKPLVIASAAPDPQRRQIIGELLGLILAQHGGVVFLQHLALLGAVYGFVDVLVKFCPQATRQDEPSAGALPSAPPVPSSGALAPSVPSAPTGQADRPGLDDASNAGASTSSLKAALAGLARMIRLEIVEPARALPLLSPLDWRDLTAYGQVYDLPLAHALHRATPRGRRLPHWWQRLLGTPLGAGYARQTVRVVELITPTAWRRYEDDVLVDQGTNSLGRIPLVHIQNAPLPFEYAGVSDVEGLIPLQDELNTRLSDRASRITLQSVRMYLGIGIENFTQQPIAPGRMWSSDNPDARVQEFGGDAAAPSETEHVADIREAMDKHSCVTPVAAGAIKDRIGRLTSAAALRVTLLALLAKTDRKRTSYGLGIEQICELALAWLDRAGLFATRPEERRVELHWPSPLPENDIEKLQEARMKAELGVDRQVVLRELGY